MTPDGFFDPAKFPIEVPIRQCLDATSEEFRHGCQFLGTMAVRGRADAGIFLLGLLRYHENDLATATVVVECLQNFHDARCADVLVGELRRVPSSNRTRRYLDAVIRALGRLPSEMVTGRFDDLARDTAFSPRMRAKFASAGSGIAPRWRSSNDLDDGF